jgi:hypothetical protein
MTTTGLSPHALRLKYDQPVLRYTSYPTAAAFRDAVGEEQLRRQLGETSDAPPLALRARALLPPCLLVLRLLPGHHPAGPQGGGALPGHPGPGAGAGERRPAGAAAPGPAALGRRHPQLPQRRRTAPALGADRPPLRAGAQPGGLDRGEPGIPQPGSGPAAAPAGLQPHQLRHSGRQPRGAAGGEPGGAGTATAPRRAASSPTSSPRTSAISRPGARRSTPGCCRWSGAWRCGMPRCWSAAT